MIRMLINNRDKYFRAIQLNFGIKVGIYDEQRKNTIYGYTAVGIFAELFFYV